MQRFSDKLVRIECYTDQACEIEILPQNHPKLFPKNMSHIRARLNDEQGDQSDDIKERRRNTSMVYEKLYSERSNPVRFSPHLVIGLRDEIECEQKCIEACYQFVMQDEDKELFLEDFEAVKCLTILRFYDYGDVRTEYLPLLTSLFRGLKELALDITSKMYFEEAMKLKNAIEDLNITVSLRIQRRSLPGDSMLILDSHISHFHFTFCDITALINLKELVIDFSKSPADMNRLLDVPKSLTSIQIPYLNWRDSDSVADFLAANGGQLEKFEMYGLVYAVSKEKADEHMKRLLEAIGDNCDKLKVLHLNYNVTPSIYLEFLTQYLEKIGPSLTDIEICYASLTDAVIDTIVRCCTILKRLYLESNQSDQFNVEQSYEKLKTLGKLQAVTLRIKYY
ncbi:hypothetical protein HDE_10874 [Halotydeus destructor]|nr:hypothetical protein HDE_10874 [Halotydeus destructor]